MFKSLTRPPAEQIVCVKRRRCVADELQAQGLAGEEVELAFFEQFLVAAAEPLLQPRHADYHTDGSGGTATLLAFGEENLEQALVNLGSVETVELVVPFLRIGVLLRGADVKEHHGGREHVHLGVGVGLLEHLVSY